MDIKLSLFTQLTILCAVSRLLITWKRKLIEWDHKKKEIRTMEIQTPVKKLSLHMFLFHCNLVPFLAC